MEQYARVGIRIAILAVVAGWLAAGFVVSAQSQKFQAERNRLHLEAMAAQKARGFVLDDPRLAKFPPAALQPPKVQKVLPGGSVSLAVAGVIPAGATVIVDRDGAILSGAALSSSKYSARMTVGAGEGPGYVNLYAFTPVSFAHSAVPVAFIDTIYRFELKGADGLTIKLSPTEKAFAFSNEDRDANLKYLAEFYKPGEIKPFETRTAVMTWYASEELRARMDVNVGDPPKVNSPEEEMNEIGKKLADPKLTEAQREALTEKFTKAQMRMMDELLKNVTAEAAKAADKKTDDFGCRLIQIRPGVGNSVAAGVSCGKNFYKGSFQTTGTMVQVK